MEKKYITTDSAYKKLGVAIVKQNYDSFKNNVRIYLKEKKKREKIEIKDLHGNVESKYIYSTKYYNAKKEIYYCIMFIYSTRYAIIIGSIFPNTAINDLIEINIRRFKDYFKEVKYGKNKRTRENISR